MHQMEQLRLSLERAHAEKVEHLTNVLNAEKVHALNSLEYQVSTQSAETLAALQDENEQKISQLVDEHKSVLEDLNSELSTLFMCIL